MTKMLRSKINGMVFHMNADMARHDHMEEIDVPDPQFEAAAAEKPAPTKPAKKAGKKAKTAPVDDDLSDLDLD